MISAAPMRMIGQAISRGTLQISRGRHDDSMNYGAANSRL